MDSNMGSGSHDVHQGPSSTEAMAADTEEVAVGTDDTDLAGDWHGLPHAPHDPEVLWDRLMSVLSDMCNQRRATNLFYLFIEYDTALRNTPGAGEPSVIWDHICQVLRRMTNQDRSTSLFELISQYDEAVRVELETLRGWRCCMCEIFTLVWFLGVHLDLHP